MAKKEMNPTIKDMTKAERKSLINDLNKSVGRNNETRKKMEAAYGNKEGGKEYMANINAFIDKTNSEISADSKTISGMRKENSRAQYNHERSVGDPNALKLSFEEWKKL